MSLSFIPINMLWAIEGLDSLPDTITRVKESVVGIGTYKKIRRTAYSRLNFGAKPSGVTSTAPRTTKNRLYYFRG